jgi:hypothetical protein
VYAEHLVVDNGRQTEVVEDLRAIPPHVYGTVFLEAFVVETVYLGDLPGLMVSSNQGNPIRIPHLLTAKCPIRRSPCCCTRDGIYLKSQQQKEGFHTVVAAVDKITEEQVIRIRALSTDFKQLDKVIELSMNISTNL